MVIDWSDVMLFRFVLLVYERSKEDIDGMIEKEVPDMPLTSAGIGADCHARFANSQEQMVRT